MEDYLDIVPIIKPVGDGKQRPFWSVMMPVYRPSEQFFRLALESVLQHDEGGVRMQIEVVDDCSPDEDVKGMVRDIGKGRVAFSRTQKKSRSGRVLEYLHRAGAREVGAYFASR